MFHVFYRVFLVNVAEKYAKMLPSGKRLHSYGSYGKSPSFMGKSTINGHFQ
jgi:hypothetical protein